MYGGNPRDRWVCCAEVKRSKGPDKNGKKMKEEVPRATQVNAAREGPHVVQTSIGKDRMA